MFFFKRKVWIDTERLYLRAPVQTDYRQWSELRYASKEFLTPWEPTWSPDHLSRKAFSNRVYWSQKNINGGTAIPLFMFRREDDKLVGRDHLGQYPPRPCANGDDGILDWPPLCAPRIHDRSPARDGPLCL